MPNRSGRSRNRQRLLPLDHRRRRGRLLRVRRSERRGPSPLHPEPAAPQSRVLPNPSLRSPAARDQPARNPARPCRLPPRRSLPDPSPSGPPLPPPALPLHPLQFQTSLLSPLLSLLAYRLPRSLPPVSQRPRLLQPRRPSKKRRLGKPTRSPSQSSHYPSSRSPLRRARMSRHPLTAQATRPPRPIYRWRPKTTYRKSTLR